jgi:ATP-dependent DNA helicase 2 subunit 1
VDCAREMFEANEHLASLTPNVLEAEPSQMNDSDRTSPLTPFAAAMKCVSSTLQNKIISSDADRVGVLLFNSNNVASNPAGFKHIHLLMDLEVPSAARIKECERLAGNPEAAQTEIGSASEDSPLGNVFWTCANIFAASRTTGTAMQTAGTKRIFLFTCEDVPNRDNPALQRAARTRGRDLTELGITMELFAIPRNGRATFNTQIFYKPILNKGNDDFDDGDFAESSLGKFEELLVRVRRREMRKRALTRTSLILAPGFEVSVRMYLLYKEAQRGQFVWMDERSEEVVMPNVQWIAEDTGAIIQPRAMNAPSNIKYSFEYGEERVVFSEAELEKLKRFGDEQMAAGLYFIGFKPLRSLPLHHQLTHSTFIYPDDAEVKGSASVCAALLEAAAEAGKFMLCRWVGRRTTASGGARLVALLPQREVLDESLGTQKKAPGFHMIPLPFAEDIRSFSFDDDTADALSRIDDELVKRAREIVSKLALGASFAPENIDNPALQRHYAYLQALALEQEEPEGVDDASLPDLERVERRVGSQIGAFMRHLQSGQERTEASREPTPAKRAKTVAAADEVIEGIRACAESELNSFTAAQLKAFLEAEGLKPKRLKADLVEQVIEMRANIDGSSANEAQARLTSASPNP